MKIAHIAQSEHDRRFNYVKLAYNLQTLMNQASEFITVLSNNLVVGCSGPFLACCTTLLDEVCNAMGVTKELKIQQAKGKQIYEIFKRKINKPCSKNPSFL